MGNPSSNTRECFSEFIGQKIIGVLFNVPTSRGRENTKTIVFEDGRGLTIQNGSFWIEEKEFVAQAIQKRIDELSQVEKELSGLVKLAGDPSCLP
jgi:hypothetical protein